MSFSTRLQSIETSPNVYDDGRLYVEHDNYYAACDGQHIRLPRTEFLIVSRLVRTPERYVSSEDLWQTAWNGRKPFNAVSLHVYMYRLRRKFMPFGVEIETMINVGYRLIPAKPIVSTGNAE